MNRFAPQDPSASSKKVSFPDHELMRTLCGEHNAHLRILEKKIGLDLHVRGNVVFLEGVDWEVELAEKILIQLYELIKADYPLYPNDVEFAVRILIRFIL